MMTDLSGNKNRAEELKRLQLSMERAKIDLQKKKNKLITLGIQPDTFEKHIKTFEGYPEELRKAVVDYFSAYHEYESCKLN